jgi:hypothetical protein
MSHRAKLDNGQRVERKERADESWCRAVDRWLGLRLIVSEGAGNKGKCPFLFLPFCSIYSVVAATPEPTN